MKSNFLPFYVWRLTTGFVQMGHIWLENIYITNGATKPFIQYEINHTTCATGKK